MTVVAVPGAGGPELAAELRRAGADHPATVRLVVVAPRPEVGPVLVGDPLSGVFWPVEPDERLRPRQQAAEGASVRRLQWFLWEMGIDASCEIRRGDALVIAAELARDADVDAVLFAAPDRRRWRATARRVTARARHADVEVRCAFDRRPARFERLAASASPR